MASTATPSTPPSSRIALVAPEAWPAWSVRTEESIALADGANTSAMPAPAMMNGHDHARVGQSASMAIGGQPAERDRLQRQPGDHEQAAAEALGEDAGERRDDHRRRRSTRAASARPAGVLPSTFWMYWVRKKIEPNIPKYIASETTLVTAKQRLAKNSHRQHRLGSCAAR